jgi:putative ABC transport system permease protein
MLSGFFITLRIASRALAKNKLRAGLTVLGVVIGIAAVTAMVSLGQSASQLVQGQLQGLGTNVVIVFPGNQKQGGGVRQAVSSLTAADSDAIVEHCNTIVASSPIVVTQAQVVYGNANYQPRELVGVGEQFLTVRNWVLHRRRHQFRVASLRHRPHRRQQVISNVRSHRRKDSREGRAV